MARQHRHPSAVTSVERHQIWSMATYQHLSVAVLAQLFRLRWRAIRKIIRDEEEDRGRL